MRKRTVCSTSAASEVESRLIADGTVSGPAAKDVLAVLVTDGG